MTKHDPIFAATAHQPYRFTQGDYLLLAEHGAFDRVAKAELIGGVIVAVNAQYSRHAKVQTWLLRALGAACDSVGDDLGAWVEVSVSIDDGSMPQPDICVSRNLPDDGPIPLESVALVVEVADSSLADDLGVKLRLYASNAIAEYWVADVDAGTMHQFWSPLDGTYAKHRQQPFGEAVSAVTIPGLRIETDRL